MTEESRSSFFTYEVDFVVKQTGWSRQEAVYWLAKIDLLAVELGISRGEVIEKAIFLDACFDNISQRNNSVVIEMPNPSPEIEGLIQLIWRNFYD